MYPGTIFRWHDQSEIVTSTPVDSVDNSPLFLQVFSSDKGTEDLSAYTVRITTEAVFSVEILKSRLSCLIIEYLRAEYKELIGIVLFIAVLEAFLRR